jgi:hypothetical protein
MKIFKVIVMMTFLINISTPIARLERSGFFFVYSHKKTVIIN